MRVFSFALFGLLFFMILALFFNANPNIEPETILNNVSNVHNKTFNITETIGYSNLYEEEITVEKVLFNVIHPIVYGIVVEVNTLLPLAVYVASGGYATVIMKYITIVLIFYFLFALPGIIKAILMIHFFRREKRKYKEKFWQ